jgi:hypothetical protein
MFKLKLLSSVVSSSLASSAAICSTKAFPNSLLTSSIVKLSTFSVNSLINSSFSILVENLDIISNFSFLVYWFNEFKASLYFSSKAEYFASNAA